MYEIRRLPGQNFFCSLSPSASSVLPNLTLVYITAILLSLTYWRLVWQFCRSSKPKNRKCFQDLRALRAMYRDIAMIYAQ